MTITVLVNGAPREVAPSLRLDALVATLTTAPSGVAAALNEEVVPRTRWPATPSTATKRRTSGSAPWA